MKRIVLLCAVCLAACSSSPKVGVDQDASEQDASEQGTSCVIATDCPSNLDHCAYAIADGCGAKGHCMATPGPPYCGALIESCGCDGTIVNGNGDCFLPAGYTTGPSLGNSPTAGSCSADGGS
jgi:hypothetical protein